MAAGHPIDYEPLPSNTRERQPNNKLVSSACRQTVDSADKNTYCMVTGKSISSGNLPDAATANVSNAPDEQSRLVNGSSHKTYPQQPRTVGHDLRRYEPMSARSC